MESRKSMGIYSFFTRTSKKDEQKITELQAQVTRLTEQNKRIVQANTLSEVDLQERLEMAHKVQVSQAEVIAALETERTQHVKDSEEYITQVKKMHEQDSLAFKALFAFVRKCATGANIRADKPGGHALVEQAKALLTQYESPDDR